MNQRGVQVGKRYRHFINGLYRVLMVVTHSETHEELVVYQQEFGKHKIWAQPLSKFMGTIELDGKTVNRFEEV